MKEPLVLLPGMMCDGRLFSPQIAAFSTEHPIVVVPLTGCNTMSDLAKQTLDILPPFFALLGLSMGGIVAMEMMRLAPKRISRIALLDTNPLGDPPEKAAIRQAQNSKVLAGGLRSVMRDEMKPNYLADGPGRQQVLDLCMTMAEDLGPNVFVDQSNAIETRPDQTKTLRSVKVPTLVLCGEHDQLCPVERHELMHSLIPNSQLVVVRGAGHLPTLEQPEQTNMAVDKWLKT